MKIEDLKIIEDEINNNKSLIEKKNSLENNISLKQKEIKFKELKIQKEQHLSKMPSQAFGSVVLYNQLNKNYQFFDKDQFNKVVRFISHIEDKEKDYRRLYLNCTKKYISDPKNIPIALMKKTKKEIDFSYKLLSILINEVNGDLVSFNKVYNKLEDAGLFMTIPEKRNQEYLNQISDKLSVVMNGLKVIFEQLEHTNDILRSIEDSTSYSASVLDDVSNHLWDISYSVRKD